MNKKVVLIAGVVLVICAAIIVASIISNNENPNNNIGENITGNVFQNEMQNVENSQNTENTENVENVVANELQAENVVQNTQSGQTNGEINQGGSSAPAKTDEEMAKEIVKGEWGDDSSVEFIAEKNADGTYTVAVRNKQTTRAEAFYTVNVQTGIFVEQDVY